MVFSRCQHPMGNVYISPVFFEGILPTGGIAGPPRKNPRFSLTSLPGSDIMKCLKSACLKGIIPYGMDLPQRPERKVSFFL